MENQICPRCGQYSLGKVSDFGSPVKRCLRSNCSCTFELDLKKIEHLKFVEELLSATIEVNIIHNTDVSQLRLLQREVRRMLIGFLEGNETWPEYQELFQEAKEQGLYGFKPEVTANNIG